MRRAISSMLALSCVSLASSAPASTVMAACFSKKSKKLVCRGRSRESMALPPGRVLVVRDGILCRPNQGRTAEYNAVHDTVNATRLAEKQAGQPHLELTRFESQRAWPQLRPPTTS